jgi:hypothetical protein
MTRSPTRQFAGDDAEFADEVDRRPTMMMEFIR